MCASLNFSHFSDLYVYDNAEQKHVWSFPSPTDLLFVLPSGEVAGEVVPVSAPVATNVTLEGVFVAMATHMNSVQDIIGKIDVAVGAVVEQLRFVTRVRRSRLAVSGAVTGRARAVATLTPVSRVPNVRRRCERHNGTGNTAGNGGRRLYEKGGFFFWERVHAGRSRRLRGEA